MAYGNIMKDAAKSSVKDLSLPPKEKKRQETAKKVKSEEPFIRKTRASV